MLRLIRGSSIVCTCAGTMASFQAIAVSIFLSLLLLLDLNQCSASRSLPSTDIEGNSLAIALPSERAAGVGESSIPRVGCNIPDPLFDPVHEVIAGRDVVWQKTPGAKAVLLMLHARGGDPFRYFDKTDNCHVCTGLPEDRLNVLEGIRRGYGNVLAIRSAGYEYDYWPPEESTDLAAYLEILDIWIKREELQDLPVVTVGVSMGGNFSAVLALYYKLDSLGIMLAPGQPDALALANSSFPPSLFVFMGKDDLVPYILKGISTVSSLGVDVDTIVLPNYALYPLFFTERIPCLPDSLSIAIFNSLKNGGWIDGDGYLTDNPRLNTDWIQVLEGDNFLGQCGEQLCWQSEIAEELYVADGVHAVSGVKAKEIFDWHDHVLFKSPYTYKHEAKTIFPL